MPMRTLRELAATYERWAADAEALADRIMAGLDTQGKEIQVKQRESAQTFLEEAERFRQLAARLRQTPDVYRSLSRNRNTYGQEVHL
jgi:hypothetical protein